MFFSTILRITQHPIEIFSVWQGGMSFHGGLLGVISALALFCIFRKIYFLKVVLSGDFFH